MIHIESYINIVFWCAEKRPIYLIWILPREGFNIHVLDPFSKRGQHFDSWSFLKGPTCLIWRLAWTGAWILDHYPCSYVRMYLYSSACLFASIWACCTRIVTQAGLACIRPPRQPPMWTPRFKLPGAATVPAQSSLEGIVGLQRIPW